MEKIEIINNLTYNVLFHQDKIIKVIPYYENLFISITGVLFYYWLCCILKRDYKKWKNERK